MTEQLKALYEVLSEQALLISNGYKLQPELHKVIKQITELEEQEDKINV